MITLDTDLAAKGRPTAQYTNFNFNSMARFGRIFMATSATGLYFIGGDSDNGGAINAVMELPTTDLGTDAVKRLRFLYFGCELYGGLMVTLYCDDKQIGRTYEIPRRRNGQQRVRVPIGRDDQGRYWRCVLTNKNGCDFSIDSIMALPVIMHRGHGFV